MGIPLGTFEPKSNREVHSIVKSYITLLYIPILNIFQLNSLLAKLLTSEFSYWSKRLETHSPILLHVSRVWKNYVTFWVKSFDSRYFISTIEWKISFAYHHEFRILYWDSAKIVLTELLMNAKLTTRRFQLFSPYQPFWPDFFAILKCNGHQPLFMINVLPFVSSSTLYFLSASVVIQFPIIELILYVPIWHCQTNAHA